MRWFIAIVVAIGGPNLALAQGPSDPLIQYFGKWAKEPTSQEIEKARPANTPGRAYVGMLCGLNTQGFVSACRVTSEAPAGAGFGKAAVALAPSYRLSTDGLTLPTTTPLSVRIWTAWSGVSGPCYPPNCTPIPAARVAPR